jgi:hypothetical protein
VVINCYKRVLITLGKKLPTFIRNPKREITSDRIEQPPQARADSFSDVTDDKDHPGHARKDASGDYLTSARPSIVRQVDIFDIGCLELLASWQGKNKNITI